LDAVKHRRPSLLLMLAATVISVAMAGCDQKLETGYEPNRLTASDADRRGYYAPAFAPETSKDSGGGGMPNISHP
jgi:hypothetical protein